MQGPESTPERAVANLDVEALGEVQPWAVTHRMIEYPGEVIVSETVNPAWGRSLEGDPCFRVVLYTVPRRIPSGQIQCRRIAMAVPRRSTGGPRASLSSEIRSVHETRERYDTQSDPELMATLRTQEASALAEFTRREAIALSMGRVDTHAEATLRSRDIFTEPSPEDWVERMVRSLLAQAFPVLPFAHDDFPAPLTSDIVEAVYRGLFQGDADARRTAAAFGPALGISASDEPSRFEAGGCAGVDKIQELVVSSGGEVDAQDVLRTLSRERGMTRTLALLYLLSYVRRERAAIELLPGHAVEHIDCGVYSSDRISWDLLPELRFRRSLADHLGVVRIRPTLSWNAVLPYATVLAHGFHRAEETVDVEREERQLSSALEELSHRAEGARSGMGTLASGLGDESSASEVVTLDRLRVMATATGYRGFHEVAVGFGSPSGLARALDLLRRAQELSNLAPAVTRARRYLDEMTFGRDHGALAVRRDAEVARLRMYALLANPRTWPSVEEAFQGFRREHAEVYLAHHQRYHEQASEVSARLERLRPQVHALQAFNEFPEFGGPVATDVPTRFDELETLVRTCSELEEDIDLEQAPSCRHCGLRLDDEVPLREAARVSRDLEAAMREYNRRLGSEGARRVLSHPTRDQLDKLIGLVQVGELAALASVLDGDVVEFLRRFLRGE